MWTARLEDTIPHWDVVLLRDGAEVARVPLDDWQRLATFIDFEAGQRLATFIDFEAESRQDRQPPRHSPQEAAPAAGPRPE
jgi:hypothetical protein